MIEAEAAAVGRHIDPEHYGALIAYTTGPLPDRVGEVLRRRRPDLDPTDVIAAGLDDLADRIKRFIEVGASKFVVVPLAEPSSWEEHLTSVARTLLPLQGEYVTFRRSLTKSPPRSRRRP